MEVKYNSVKKSESEKFRYSGTFPYLIGYKIEI